MSKIEWTDETINPVVGCTKIGAGCKNCYAERMAKRLKGMADKRLEHHMHCSNMPNGIDKYLSVVDKNGWTGNIGIDMDELKKPYKWKKPRRIFVSSMGDLFHENVQYRWINNLMYTIDATPRHTYILLTKRPQFMHNYFMGHVLPKNVWLGISASTQKELETGLYYLAMFKNCRVRFISLEPLLESISIFNACRTTACRIDFVSRGLNAGEIVSDLIYGGKNTINWVIVGGETGPGARPIHYEWVSQIQKYCSAYDIPFFFKQWGENVMYETSLPDFVNLIFFMVIGHGGKKYKIDKDTYHIIAPKKLTGRTLNGREYNEYPREVK